MSRNGYGKLPKQCLRTLYSGPERFEIKFERHELDFQRLAMYSAMLKVTFQTMHSDWQPYTEFQKFQNELLIGNF